MVIVKFLELRKCYKFSYLDRYYGHTFNFLTMRTQNWLKFISLLQTAGDVNSRKRFTSSLIFYPKTMCAQLDLNDIKQGNIKILRLRSQDKFFL